MTWIDFGAIVLGLTYFVFSLWFVVQVANITLGSRVMVDEDVYGWRMTGLLGKDGAWFVGYSRRPEQ
jgi:hypothetical protein